MDKKLTMPEKNQTCSIRLINILLTKRECFMFLSIFINLENSDTYLVSFYLNLQVDSCSKMKNRSEIEIMAAILNAAVSNWEYKTTIMINAGVSHSQLTRYLMTAVDRKLMEYSEITGLYRTAEAGLIFIKKHEEMCRIFPAISDLPEVSHNNYVIKESLNE